MNDLNYIKPHGIRILHIATGKLVVGQGTTTACEKRVGKFILVEGYDKTKLCAACSKAIAEKAR